MHKPDWYEKDPRDWPAPARVAYGVLLRAALRRLQEEAPAAKRTRKIALETNTRS